MARLTERRIVPLAVLLALAAAACASSQPVADAGRAGEYQISCGYLGWYICYERADQLCPGGYKVLAEEEDGGRRTRIACKNRETP